MTITIGKRHVLITLAALAVIGIISSSVYFFVQYRKSQALLKNPAEAAKAENKKIVETIAKTIDVPEGEEPTVASVTDLSKLAGQPFFAKAANGDRVVFYPDSKRAILYRPSTGKIIEMSAVAEGNGQVAGAATTPAPTSASSFTSLTANTPAPTATPQPRPFRLAIYNGTTTPRLANTMEATLKGKLPNATVVKKDNAVTTDHATTLVVDLTGSFANEAKSLAGAIGGTQDNLPDGEIRPDADVLVIIGSDWRP